MRGGSSAPMDRVPEGHGRPVEPDLPHGLRWGSGPCWISAMASGNQSPPQYIGATRKGKADGYNSTAARNQGTGDCKLGGISWLMATWSVRLLRSNFVSFWQNKIIKITLNRALIPQTRHQVINITSTVTPEGFSEVRRRKWAHILSSLAFTSWDSLIAPVASSAEILSLPQLRV